MYWISSTNYYIDKILSWIEDNILDRIFWKRILKRLTDAIASGFVEELIPRFKSKK